MKNTNELYKSTLAALESIDVKIEDIAKIVYDLQIEYNDKITLQECIDNVTKVLEKREVMHAVLTGLAIDKAVEKGEFPEPIQSIIKKDAGLYGVDEILPLGIVNLYGTIGLTNFGYLDKKKVGIIKEIDMRKRDLKNVNTFADDIVAAIAAAAAARIAHGYGDED
ncbi:phosphatidylglycerophosphatase A [Peptoniphilus catoniae]|uniref:phosphatidylglycerophosphatase A n=1 Tax=Peptoniphilus catoniae TaxID=1660341 RepID=UPI0010FDF6BD|nr:phosphatidylglycerophosphatase A [Peptoniphilus catoniae]